MRHLSLCCGKPTAELVRKPGLTLCVWGMERSRHLSAYWICPLWRDFGPSSDSIWCWECDCQGVSWMVRLGSLLSKPTIFNDSKIVEWGNIGMVQNSPCQRDRHSKHCQRQNCLEVQKEDACQGYSEPSLILTISQSDSWTVTVDLCNELLLSWMALQGLHEAQDHMFSWCLR